MADIGENRNVFISWSGERSKAVAEALRDWLPDVIPAARPWISTRDLEKGAQWQAEITGQLQTSNIGIFCLTPENLVAPWILFEAGSLQKGLGVNRVFTYLFEVEHKEVEPPLSVFNHTKADKSDTLRLLQVINREVGGQLTDDHLALIFDAYWPKLEKALQAVPIPKSRPVPQRTPESILSEILEAVRQRGESQPLDFQVNVLERLTKLEQAARPGALNENALARALPGHLELDGQILSVTVREPHVGLPLVITGLMGAATAAQIQTLEHPPPVIFQGRKYRLVGVAPNGYFRAALTPQ
jgi:hypothetical protein